MDSEQTGQETGHETGHETGRTPQSAAEDDARAAVAALVTTFFAAFASGPGLTERVAALRGAFLPGALVVKGAGAQPGAEPVVMDVASFLDPREALLSGGSVTDFREWPTSGRTEVHGSVAQHWCDYAKRWQEDGVERTGRGAKTLQCVRTAAGWRLSAVAWDDAWDEA